MIMRSTIAMAMMAACVAGCGEKAQTAGSTKKADAKAWAGSQSSNIAEGWKPGDKDSWEAQMRQRAQNQNEYARSAAAAPPVKAP